VEVSGKCVVPRVEDGKEEAPRPAGDGGEDPRKGGEAIVESAVREAAWNEGFKAGYREGREIALNEMRGIVGALETVRRGLENSRADLLRELEREITSLAVEIGEKLALQELTSSPEAVANLVRRVVERASEKKSLRVRLNPGDFRILQEKRKELLANMVDVGELDLVEDRTLGLGDCVVETTAGIIDARLQARMERIRNSVLGEEGAGDRPGSA
jgi:flagellar assembly protein FliH